MQKIDEALRHVGVVPVITLQHAEVAVPLARALLAGDVRCIEVTFRTAAAAAAIQQIAGTVKDMLVGAGTVLTVPQAEHALRVGARFIVSPGFDAAVVAWCQHHDLPVFPGVATPTEIQRALASDLRLLKLFPAAALGGVELLKALAGPFPEAHFLPTGGISQHTLAAYLSLPNVAACGGSWLATSSLLDAGRFQEITQRARAARAIVRRVRGEHEESEVNT
jgi:2-dehydro-3-deoxyphosphogluconate aldolase/(4S)-4-hydroxy-2-oxoglutarate aldolase